MSFARPRQLPWRPDVQKACCIPFVSLLWRPRMSLKMRGLAELRSIFLERRPVRWRRFEPTSRQMSKCGHRTHCAVQTLWQTEAASSCRAPSRVCDLTFRFERLQNSGSDGASGNTVTRSVVPATSRSLEDKGGGRFRGSVVGTNSGCIQSVISRRYACAAQYLLGL